MNPADDAAATPAWPDAAALFERIRLEASMTSSQATLLQAARGPSELWTQGSSGTLGAGASELAAADPDHPPRMPGRPTG